MSIKIKERLVRLAELKNEKDDAKKMFSDKEAAFKAYERETHKLMEVQDVKTVKIDGLGTFTRSERTYCKVLAESEEEFVSWAEEEGVADELVKRKFETKRLNALVKERLENGDDLPPGVDVTPTPYISIRKG